MHAGRWDKSAAGSHEVRGRRLGIVGYGNIGSQLSVLAEALGMSVLFFDTTDKLALGNARRCGTLDELLAESDVVTLHVDGRVSNSSFFGEEQFSRMRPGSIFLNLSRGFVVDHAALRAHVESGHIAGAAVDVFPVEPKSSGEEFVSELRGLKNVILTPHVGGSTEEAQQDIGHFVAGKLRDYAADGTTALSVNLPQVALPRGARHPAAAPAPEHPRRARHRDVAARRARHQHRGPAARDRRLLRVRRHRRRCRAGRPARRGAARAARDGAPARAHVSLPLTPSLVEALRAAVGDEHVLVDADLTRSYETDWTGRFSGRAGCVVRPADTEQVAAVVRACADAGAPVVVQGGNTGLVGGAVPAGGEVLLSLTRLTSLGEVDVVGGQVTAGAGVTLAALQAHARAAGLDFGVDLAARESATVGGLVATNAGGIRVLRYGSMRAQLLGAEAVLADGSVISRMAGLLKDGTGYDLVSLLAGSEGTLGVVTAVRLRLVPRLTARAVALLALPDAATALALLPGLRARLPHLSAAELVFADGIALVRKHARLPAPFAEEHPAYLLLECADATDPTDALVDAVAACDGPARRDGRDRRRRAARAVGVPRGAHRVASAPRACRSSSTCRCPTGRLAELCDGARARSSRPRRPARGSSSSGTSTRATCTSTCSDAGERAGAVSDAVLRAGRLAGGEHQLRARRRPREGGVPAPVAVGDRDRRDARQ